MKRRPACLFFLLLSSHTKRVVLHYPCEGLRTPYFWSLVSLASSFNIHMATSHKGLSCFLQKHRATYSVKLESDPRGSLHHSTVKANAEAVRVLPPGLLFTGARISEDAVCFGTKNNAALLFSSCSDPYCLFIFAVFTLSLTTQRPNCRA